MVKYQGTGSYFLDKLEDGVWRLELMPDVVHIRNPFGTNSLQKKLAVIGHTQWPMEVQLSDLGTDFRVEAINESNHYKSKAQNHSFEIQPGTYLLIQKGKTAKTAYPLWNSERLSNFIAPSTDVDQTWLMHTPYPQISTAGTPLLQAEIVSKDSVETVEAWFRNGSTYATSRFEHQEGYFYETHIPQELLHEGYLEYRIVVSGSGGSVTYPSAKEGNPGEWDFEQEQPYSSRVVDSSRPIYLFRAIEDAATVVGEWKPDNRLQPTSNPAEAQYQVQLEELFTQDPENLEAEARYDYSFRTYFGDKTAAREQDLLDKSQLVLKARSLVESSRPLQIALVMKDGTSYGTTIEISPEVQEYQIDLSALEPVSTVTLPRPYPTFLPYYLDHSIEQDFDISKAESVQFSIGPGLTAQEQQEAQGVGIISLYLK